MQNYTSFVCLNDQKIIVIVFHCNNVAHSIEFAYRFVDNTGSISITGFTSAECCFLSNESDVPVKFKIYIPGDGSQEPICHDELYRRKIDPAYARKMEIMENGFKGSQGSSSIDNLGDCGEQVLSDCNNNSDQGKGNTCSPCVDVNSNQNCSSFCGEKPGCLDDTFQRKSVSSECMSGCMCRRKHDSNSCKTGSLRSGKRCSKKSCITDPECRPGPCLATGVETTDGRCQRETCDRRTERSLCEEESPPPAPVGCCLGCGASGIRMPAACCLDCGGTEFLKQTPASASDISGTDNERSEGSEHQVPEPREFNIYPAEGVLQPKSCVEINIELCSNTVTNYMNLLTVDVIDVDMAVATLPLNARYVTIVARVRNLF